VSWLAFTRHQLVLDPILPSVAVLAVYLVSTGLLLLLTDRERQFVRRAFGQYLSPALVQRLADDPAALSLGGEMRELTVLFCDIRGFTSLSERLDPQDLTRLLNRFFTPMTNVLLEAGATIDKYVGDQIMAFWNAPLAIADHPRQAGLAVLRMLEALDGLNRSEGVELKVGIGLNTGPCCVGNLGSEHRFSYSAVGDAVNVAARVEGLTKQYGLSALMTESTAAGAAGLALIEVDLVRVVGRDRPIPVFTILGDAGFAARPEFRELTGIHVEMIRAYRGARFAAAAKALSKARTLAPPLLRPLYELYDERLSTLLESPPAAAWDGVYASMRK
jgi:adenylate cyclase